MSVPTWLNNAQSFPNGDNGAYNHAGDPSIAFLQTPTSTSFDQNRLQYQQMQLRMQNGNTRNDSPAAQSPMYPTQNIVPSKRTRPREGSVGASPQQYSGGPPPMARSQTPQGNYPGYQSVVNGGSQFTGPAPYQHFQQQNNNPNQSPMMQHQSFNPQGANPTVHTMSPSPFSPTVQGFGAQNSPSQSDTGSRVNTPQGGGHHYQQFNTSQATTTPVNASITGMSTTQFPNPTPLNPQQQRMYEARARQMQNVQSQVQANGMNIPQRQPGQLVNPLGHPINAMQNYQMAQMRQQTQAQTQVAQAQIRPNNPDQLLRNMVQYMQARGLPFNPQPVIASKPINCVHIFMYGVRLGGSGSIQAHNRWSQVAQMLSIPQPQLITAGQELQAYWTSNLIQWERHFFQLQQAQVQQQQQQQHRQRAMAESVRVMNNAPDVDPTMAPGSFSPTKKVQDIHGQRLMQPPTQIQNQPQAAARPGPSLQHDPRQPLQNGFRMHQQAHLPGRQLITQGSSLLGEQQETFQNLTQQQISSPKINSITSQKSETDTPILLRSPRPLESYYTPKIQALDPSINESTRHEDFGDDTLLKKVLIANEEADISSENDTRAEYHGGLPISDAWFKDTLDVLVKYKHSMPQLNELGVIDIQALILSIKSGIQGEVRLALDIIAALSHGSPPPLKDCEELLDTLIDFAGDQVEILANGSLKTSNTLQISSYQELVRGFKMQSYMLQEVPDTGTRCYDLGQAANKLLSVTTILRNLSLLPESLESLREPNVIRMITTVMRHLGTRNMFLQTYENALDFSKDIVIFLSSLSPYIDLTSKDESLSILHFLLSFAPEPRPNIQGKEISFAFYAPVMHRYLPHAVDSLAKLLARDPNRSLYRGIFASENTTSPPFDLLTRAFGLAVSVIPEVSHHKGQDNGIIALRNPTLAQGLLSAEILIGMIPTSAHDLAYSWLRSKDGLVSRLMAVLSLIAKIPTPEPQRHRDGRPRTDDDLHLGYRMINARGLAVLRKLGERAQDSTAFTTDLSTTDLLFKKGAVKALGSSKEPEVVRNLCVLAGLESY